MNILDLVLILIIAATIAIGYSRGFIISLLSLLRCAVGLPIAFFAADKYNMKIYTEFVREVAIDKIEQGLQASVDADGFVSSVRQAVDELPFGISGIIDLSFLDNVSQANLTESIVDNIVEPVALVIIKIVIFILTVSVFYAVTFIIARLFRKLDKVRNMPLKKTNKFLGAVFGAVKAAAVIAVLSAVLVFVRDFIFASSQNEFVNMVNSSAIIEFVNKINPLVDLL